MHSRCRRTTIALTPRRTCASFAAQSAAPNCRAGTSNSCGGTPVPDIFRTLLVDGNDVSELITNAMRHALINTAARSGLSAGHSEGLSNAGVG